MEKVGFQFETEQKPHLQNRKENELKFIHPKLIKRLEENGSKVRAKKFYIKPLSNEPDCEIGFVTDKSSPLYKLNNFTKSNSNDTFENTPAWTNSESNLGIDSLLKSIEDYLKTTSDVIEDDINTFLFTWNPNKWVWEDLQEDIEHLEKVGYVEKR